ncbi:MAG: hypothetical protein M1281_04725 [Chloroflexi bacterium]|nr:hypothetical protein [Chloroflexota bacterium]
MTIDELVKAKLPRLEEENKDLFRQVLEIANQAGKNAYIRRSKQDHEYEGRQGRKFAPEFLDIMAQTAYITLNDWLEANHAPKKVIRLLEETVIFQDFSGRARKGKLDDIEGEMIYQDIPELTELIMKLGGSFHDYSGSIQRKKPPKWNIREELTKQSEPADAV